MEFLTGLVLGCFVGSVGVGVTFLCIIGGKRR